MTEVSPGELILLDAQDDIASVKARLTQTKAAHVGIVDGGGSRLLRGPVTMRLLHRCAQDLAVQLAVISADPSVRRLAQEEELPIFGSVRAYRQHIARGQRGALEGQIFLFLRRAAMMGMASLAVAILVLATLAAIYLLLPAATVTLYPAIQPIAKTVQIRADPAVLTPNYAAGEIPARVVHLLLEGTEQVPVSGKEQTAATRARGRVTLKNRTDHQLLVPKDTAVSTATGIRFLIAGEVTVPAGTEGIAQVEVIAEKTGESGNVGRGAIDTVEGPLGLEVAIFNEEPTSGGGQRIATTVTEADRQRVRGSLLERIRREGLAKLAGELQEREWLSEPSLNLAVLDEDYDREAGDEAQVLNLRMQVRVSGTMVSGHEIDAVVQQSLAQEVKPGFQIPPGGVTASTPEVLRVDGNALVLAVRAQATALALLNGERIVQEVRWKTAADAESYLSRNWPLAKEPQVIIEPDWATRSLRVQVVIDMGTPSAAGQ